MTRDEATARLVRKLWNAVDPERRATLELTKEERARLASLLVTDAEVYAWMRTVEPVPPEDQPWVDELIDNTLRELISEHSDRPGVTE